MLKHFPVIAWMTILFLFIGGNLCTIAAEKKTGDKKKVKGAVGMPIYKPPLRGAPVGRVGGATRGAEEDVPTLVALVPDHIGLTTSEQPTLYWYLSKPTGHPLEVTLIDDDAIDPVLETTIQPPVPEGIHRIHLKDHHTKLAVGKPYGWFVALVRDPDHRSNDIVAGGAIERVERPNTLQGALDRAGTKGAYGVFAEAGLWYDALDAISHLIEADPGDTALREKRSALLRQVNISNAE